MELDLLFGQHQVIYGGDQTQRLLSIWRSKADVTSSGGLIITEFEGGRVIETDADGNVIWEFLNRYGSEEVAEITEAWIYPGSYFSITGWTCSGLGA